MHKHRLSRPADDYAQITNSCANVHKMSPASTALYICCASVHCSQLARLAFESAVTNRHRTQTVGLLGHGSKSAPNYDRCRCVLRKRRHLEVFIASRRCVEFDARKLLHQLVVCSVLLLSQLSADVCRTPASSSSSSCLCCVDKIAWRPKMG